MATMRAPMYPCPRRMLSHVMTVWGSSRLRWYCIDRMSEDSRCLLDVVLSARNSSKELLLRIVTAEKHLAMERVAATQLKTVPYMGGGRLPDDIVERIASFARGDTGDWIPPLYVRAPASHNLPSRILCDLPRLKAAVTTEHEQFALEAMREKGLSASLNARRKYIAAELKHMQGVVDYLLARRLLSGWRRHLRIEQQ